ncbi:MAG: CRISPR-associated endoribonuclease Cas6 [Elusimicrobiota bacterium]|nr:CRISPR-associated endoribonuclease Cas6 [Endomicrobiia bacterium]MDW8166466.1 CRISPR-associated endoribonuclease Cas6 [Elusimicrobiota bacterium]
MRVKINFYINPSEALTLPCHYNEIIQGFIYKKIDKWISTKIHDQGFKDPDTERIFKLFTFSRLIPQGMAKVKDGKITFYGSVSLIVASPISEFIQSFATNLIKAGNIKLSEHSLILDSVTVEGLPEYREKILVKTLSPITVYSTLITADGRKKTYYYSPFEDEFEKLLIENLSKKLRALTGKTISQGSIKPYKVNSKNQRIILYKNTVIKGWDGVFELRLPIELFPLAFDTGLGAKNSQGFGCVEVY